MAVAQHAFGVGNRAASDENHVMRRAASVRMTVRKPMLRLLAVGAGPRVVGAALIVAALWAGFFWATSSPGGL